VSPSDPTQSQPKFEDDERRELVEHLRSVRDEARDAPQDRPSLPERAAPARRAEALTKIADSKETKGFSSPAREQLNASWNVADATPQSFLGKLIWPLRRFVRRIAVGSLVERQVQLNSAQVRFDNEVIEYVDARLDRMGQHYDRVLGLHGKRMEEIDERHLILQQELIRHVHDLVERIEFVFESAETNHLQVDGALRETREELKDLVNRLENLPAASRDES
jgi:hypothetical protein